MSTAAAESATRYQHTFDGRTDQVTQVRRQIAAHLDGCPVAADAILIASELAANAVLHSASAGEFFTVRCQAQPGHVWIEVQDLGGPWQPRPSGNHLHGLDIIQPSPARQLGNQDHRRRGLHRVGTAPPARADPTMTSIRLCAPRYPSPSRDPAPGDTMTTDPGCSGPRRPLHEMTTEDLSRFRYQLERALQRMIAEDPGRGALQQQLAAVRAILQARGRTQDAHTPAVRPLPPGTYRLTARIFAGLFTDYDLHNVTSGYIALPKGSPCVC